jgi:hypothetical protein
MDIVNFNFEYVFSVIIILIVCDLLKKSNPEMNSIIILMVGLFTGFITLYILNNYFPTLFKTITNIYNFNKYQLFNNFNSTGYLHIWPPIFAVLIIFIILLYMSK